jgi:hypothetical protein
MAEIEQTATISEQPITTANNGQFKAGNPGRPVGPNKLTKTVKETVLAVFNNLQEDPEANLLKWAKGEPTEFYKIAAKLIPTEITGSVKQIIIVTDRDE